MAGDDDLPSLDDWGPVDEDFWGSGASSSFLVPPPPPPPSVGSVCSGAPFYCELEGGPMGAHFDRAAFPSLPIIAVCSSVVLVAVLVASFLLWRHKSKVQNLLPCKNEQQGHLGELGAANGVTYEDVLINHHPTRLPQAHIPGTQALMPLEILDVKLGEIGPPQITTLHHTTFYPNRDHRQVIEGKPFNPVYEEVSQAPSDRDKSMTGKSYESDFDESGKLGGRSLTSDDDFAEDEFSVAEYPSREGSGQCSATSSVRGSTGGDLCKDPVSSDEGNGEDCDYMISDLPQMLPSDNSFNNYPRKHLHVHSNTSSERPNKICGNPLQSHNHQHTTYPLPERTVNVMPPTQRINEPVKGNKTHSTPLTDCKKQHMSSSHVPSAVSFAPILSSPNTKSNFMPANAQWSLNHGHENERISYPTGNPSQENIYSTIDEDELPDYPVVHPSLTSLACPQRGSPSNKQNNPVVPKSMPVRSNDRAIPPLSQRNADDNGSSYGDIRPAFNSASFT